MTTIPSINKLITLTLNLIDSKDKAYEDKETRIYLDYKDRIPEIIMMFKLEEPSRDTHLENLMIKGSKFMARLIKEDWDTDDVSWSLEVGGNFHDAISELIPEGGTRIEKSDEDDDIDNGWFFIKLKLTDWAS